MDTKQSIRLINAVGGDTAFARLIGIDKTSGYQQRVNNWKRRGIPDGVVLKNYEVINRVFAVVAEYGPDTKDKEAA